MKRMILAAISAVVAVTVYGGNLSADRATPELAGKNIGLPCSTNIFYAGGLLCVSGGIAYPAVDASGYVCVGKNRTYLDNSTAVSGARVEAQRGVFRWDNGGSFTRASIGSLAYVKDNHSVTTAAIATYDVVAGVIVDVDSSGVWVDSYAIGGAGAASLTTVTTSGNASVGGALAVAGATTLSGTAAVTGATTFGGAVSLGSGTNDAVTVTGRDVIFSGLPASTNGLTTGRLYLSNGAIKVY